MCSVRGRLQASLMASFDSVLALLSHYVDEARRTSSERHGGTGRAPRGSQSVDEARRTSSERHGGLTRMPAGGDAGRPAVARSSCVFVDRTGRRDEPIVLSTPYRARAASLRHLCRLTINRALDGRDVDRLCVVPSLRHYLKLHPFPL